MKKYQIIATTNGYIANRDVMFNGKTNVVIDSDLSLREARIRLLDLYNSKFENERPYAGNWGMAVIQSRHHVEGATPTFENGTRSFEWDSRRYSIEEL